MHPLRVLERHATVRIDDVDRFGICNPSLDVQKESHPTKQGGFEVVCGLLPFRNALLKIVDDRRRKGERKRVARLERIAVSDVSDLRDVRLDEPKPISLNGPAPLP